jgi:excinuclease ABC subunit C
MPDDDLRAPADLCAAADLRAPADLRAVAARLPQAPGVYLFKDSSGAVLYVGKAKKLRTRVSSYFNRGMTDPRMHLLAARTASIETVLTASESEAFLLENSLIKRFAPRYNINLKDGKSYPVIRLTAEEFPRVYRTRTIVFDGSEYFGPFAKANQIDVYLDLIDRLFPLRKRGEVFKRRPAPCLNHYINRCAAPCIGAIGAEEYAERVRAVRKLVSGRADDLSRDLTRRMKQTAAEQRFELAAALRDQLQAIRDVTEQQHVAGVDADARDYVGHFAGRDWHRFLVLQFRGGNLVGRERFHVLDPGPQLDDAAARARFLVSYYGGRATALAGLTIYTGSVEEPEALAAALGALVPDDSPRRRAAPRVHVPKRGRHAQVLRLAEANARQDAERANPGIDRERGIEELGHALNLPLVPRRIEGFDISHLGGRDTVASLVVFDAGQPAKGEYRHFRIRSLGGRVDDFEAMREVVARRYARVLNDRLPRPDLVLVDGGAGQVSAAKGILDGLGLTELPLAGLAKRNEEIYLPGRSAPLVLPEGSAALRLLQAVRDESHRFATSHHKRLRTKRVAGSVLEEVAGIGPVRSRRLLQRFASVSAVALATPQEISRHAGVSEETASTLLAHLERRHACRRQ